MIAALASTLGVLGLAVGSLLNAVISRVPAGRALLRPRGACPSCDRPIRWYDQVPLVSWLALRGCCRDCGARISIRYPLVELAGGVAFALVTLCFAPGGWLVDAPAGGTRLVAQVLVLAAYLLFAASGIALAAIDLDVRRLPDRIVYPTTIGLALLFAAAAAIEGDLAAITTALIASAACFAFFLLIDLIRPGAMGFGDIKLAIAVGLATGWIGWPSVALGLLAGFLLGGAVGLVLIIVGRVGRRSAIPYGPWLLSGAWVGIVLGPTAWAQYSVALGLV